MTVEGRAKPQSYIARSHGNERVRKVAETVFMHKPAIIKAVQSGHFDEAKRLIEQDDSLSALHCGLARRWMNIERLYRSSFKTPLPS